MIPLTPTSYISRVLASLPKSKIDCLTPLLRQSPLSREKDPGTEGDKTVSVGDCCKSGVGTIAMRFATTVDCSNSLRRVSV
jgi:hypothetical protein